MAFVVVQGTLPEDPASELRGALRAYLPESMLPAQVQVLADMPRLANGKIDRQALQGRELQAVQRDFVAPGTPWKNCSPRAWRNCSGWSA